MIKPAGTGKVSCFCGTMEWVIRGSSRKQVLLQLQPSRFGMVKTKAMTRLYFWRPTLDKDVEMLARNCAGCERISTESTVANLGAS